MQQTLIQKLGSRKFLAPMAGVVAAWLSVYAGQLDAGQAVAATVALVLTFVGAEAYVDREAVRQQGQLAQLGLDEPAYGAVTTASHDECAETIGG